MDHEDFAGNAGTINAGDLQFMTAGKGIMHAEMPHQNPDGSANIGMQLWVDLPEKLKKCEPRYRDLRASEIPNIDVDEGRVHVKIISGKSHGVDSVQELAYTPVWILDIEIAPGGKIAQTLPEGWNAFAYTLSGSTAFGVGNDRTTVGEFHNVVFERKGDEVFAEVDEGAKEKGHFSKLSHDFDYIVVSRFPQNAGIPRPKVHIYTKPMVPKLRSLTRLWLTEKFSSMTVFPSRFWSLDHSQLGVWVFLNKKTPPRSNSKTELLLRSPGIEPGAHRNCP